jgi:demethylspheroidene O-methyltransferase
MSLLDPVMPMPALKLSIGLAERRGRSVYGLGQLGAALAGNRAALSLIEHQPLLYADLQDPVALLRGSTRGTGIARYWPYSAAAHPTELAEEEVASYSALMTASQPLIAMRKLLKKYGFVPDNHSCACTVRSWPVSTRPEHRTTSRT